MNIIGIAERQGTFQERPYHNVMFHCIKPFEDEQASGSECKVVKVKYETLAKVLNKRPTEKEIFALVGKSAEFYYNEFQTVVHVQFGGASQSAS
jgi:hypothetical protein